MMYRTDLVHTHNENTTDEINTAFMPSICDGYRRREIGQFSPYLNLLFVIRSSSDGNGIHNKLNIASGTMK